MDDFEKELRVGFLDEAEQSIADAEVTFLSLETEPNNSEHINKIFRLAHNLKGSSKAVGFEQFGMFTHEFESFVLRAKNNELQITAKAISVMLKVTDFVRVMIGGLRANLEAVFDVDDLLAEMKNFSENQTPATAVEPVAPPTSATTFEEPSAPAQAQATIISLPPKPKKVETLKAEESATSSSSTLGAPGATAQSKTAVVDESIRVSMGKVETLLNLVGEMVILQSVVSQNTANSDFTNFKKTIDHLGKVTKEIQDISMSLRIVPVKTTFQKMQRIVRDTAQLLNKDVMLTLFGEETELDKSVLENINDPLVHLIRNSVDHGIESAEKRLASGKKAQGSVHLKAFHRSGRLVIEVIDDGAGLDSEKLKQIAISKGIIKETDVLTEAESYKLIFAPGF
ncbi:MAG: Hpt domain-containing protein, partial [Bdellovibrionota bacterium]